MAFIPLRPIKYIGFVKGILDVSEGKGIGFRGVAEENMSSLLEIEMTHNPD